MNQAGQSPQFRAVPGIAVDRLRVPDIDLSSPGRWHAAPGRDGGKVIQGVAAFPGIGQDEVSRELLHILPAQRFPVVRLPAGQDIQAQILEQDEVSHIVRLGNVERGLIARDEEHREIRILGDRLLQIFEC